MLKNTFEIIEPNEKDLNEFVEKNQYSSIFQTAHMVEVYKNLDDCDPISLAVVNKDGEILSSLVAITFTESKTFKYFSRHSTIRGGPIFSQSIEGAQATELLLNEYNHIAKCGALYSRIYPLFNSENVHDIAISCGYQHDEWLNFIINLQKSKEDLWKNMNKPRKKGIKRAEKSGVSIEEMKNCNDLPIFYELLKNTHERAKVPLKNINFFESVFNRLGKKQYAKFYFAKYNNQYIAARLILTYCNTMYDWYAGADTNFNDKYPSEYLIWNILNIGREMGYKIFDFGGAGSPYENYGVREFKRRFGGDLVNYGRYTNVHQSFKLKLANTSYKLINNLR